MSAAIRDIARRRGITELAHFTPASNLQSILETGLLSRQILDERQIFYTYTDSWRNDGRLDGVSLSIHGINESMFSAKLRQSRTNWVILVVDASVLWTHRCEFCWVNAASRDIVWDRRFRGGPRALNEMFADRTVSLIDKRSMREAKGLADNRPTMNDAEVQVLSPISPDHIQSLIVGRERCKAEAEAAMAAAGRGVPVEVISAFFT